MRRQTRSLGRNGPTTGLDLRRWFRTATPRELAFASVGVVLALLVVAISMRYIIIGVVVIGVVFVHIGGGIIGAVSLADRFTAFTPPLWFHHLKWATAPMRLFDTGLMLYEEFDIFSELIE